jgi:hypothetical protein
VLQFVHWCSFETAYYASFRNRRAQVDIKPRTLLHKNYKCNKNSKLVVHCCAQRCDLNSAEDTRMFFMFAKLTSLLKTGTATARSGRRFAQRARSSVIKGQLQNKVLHLVETI